MKLENRRNYRLIALLSAGLLIGSTAAIAGHHNGEGQGHAHGKGHGKGNPHHEMHQDGKHGHENAHGNMHEGEGHGHMMEEKEMGHHGGNMDSKMREVMGHGRVNKVMAGHGMVNIKHEPMPEMNWPKMSMNFKTQKQVDLSNLKPGQQVDFKLLVDEENNYVIKEITVK